MTISNNEDRISLLLSMSGLFLCHQQLPTVRGKNIIDMSVFHTMELACISVNLRIIEVTTDLFTAPYLGENPVI